MRGRVPAGLRRAFRNLALKLIVCPLAELDEALASRPSHVLSLISPGAASPVCAVADHLVLRFNDINAPTPGLTGASAEDLESLLVFAQGWAGAAPLLAHCWAGISRSTAAAYIIACARNAPGREVELARQLRTAAPEATPNPWMIALADTLLNRNGCMSAAIAAIGRGREAGQGVLFTLEL
jgi:predicted protein tyrosine phosphatase